MRLFIALELDNSNIIPLKEKLNNVNGRFVSDKNLHLTLAFLGDTDISKINEIKEIINSLSLNLSELKSRFVTTFHKDVIVLKFDKNKLLMDYQNKLVHLLEKSNISFDKKSFIPHVTLIRKSNVELNFKYEKSFKIKAIHLFSSTLNEYGSIYDSLFKKSI